MGWTGGVPGTVTTQEDKPWGLQHVAQGRNSISVNPGPFGADTPEQVRGPSFGSPWKSCVNTDTICQLFSALFWDQ